MFATADDLGDRLQALVDDLDPECFDGPGAVRMLDAFTRLENLAAYGKTVMARRVEYTRAWKRAGDATPAQFVARRTGTSVGQATATLKTARQMRDLGAVEEAAKAGELSLQQTSEIADACSADPDATQDLLSLAQSAGMTGLRDECRRVKAAARTDELAHDDAIRRSRYLRTWTDRDGAGRGEWKLQPEAQARLLARLGVETDAVAHEMKSAGAPIESRDAYTADALVRLADGRGGGKAQVALHLRVDHSAFVRGHTEPGEICEIEGVGPVPVATARNLSTDALIYVLATKGADITHYAKHGRYMPDALRLALEARDSVCIASGCSVRDDLEIHHRHPVADGGLTSLADCCRLCRWHHYLCTHHGWEVGGSAESGWSFDPPSGRAPPDDLKLAV